MKLLLDENLSRRLVPLLQTVYPNSSQVALLKLETASDREIWEYAKINDFIIVTRDSDFHELSTLYGAPPKVIWLKTGNQSKAATLRILNNQNDQINTALTLNDKNCIEIYG
jgi:predicted nuclease of predicted toxin-antitoxin system